MPKEFAGGAKAFGGDQEERFLLRSPLWAIELVLFGHLHFQRARTAVMEYR